MDSTHQRPFALILGLSSPAALDGNYFPIQIILYRVLLL